MAQLLKLVQNQVELETYIRATAEKLAVTSEAIYAELRRAELKDKRVQELSISKEERERQKQQMDRPQYPAALLTLLGLSLQNENIARGIADVLDADELPGIDPVSTAINTVVNLALNGEYDSVDSVLNNMLNVNPEPEISRIMVENNTWCEPEKAVLDCVAELRKIKKERQKNKLRAELAVEKDDAKRMAILQQLNALK